MDALFDLTTENHDFPGAPLRDGDPRLE